MRMISMLPELMEGRGIDQKTLASHTGLSPTTVGKYYRGQFQQIDRHTVETLCLYFGLKSISQLIEIAWEEGDIEGRRF